VSKLRANVEIRHNIGHGYEVILREDLR
jgi:hypothetical protein